MVLSNNELWRDATRSAIARLTARLGSDIFDRQQLIESELDQIVADVGAEGATPSQTLSRVLQELGQAGDIEFVDGQGTYRFNRLN